MDDRTSQEGFSDQQREGLRARQDDHDRTLAAMHRLEEMLADPTTGRQQAWQEAVLEALAELKASARAEAANAERPDSLLSDLKRTQPWLRNRVRGVRLQYQQILETIESLQAEFGGRSEAKSVDVADVRERLSWLMSAMRHQRARESDLIYEAYYEAFRVDLARERAATEDA